MQLIIPEGFTYLLNIYVILKLSNGTFNLVYFDEIDDAKESNNKKKSPRVRVEIC